MPSSHRRKSVSVINQLQKQPYLFGFVPAVHLIEQVSWTQVPGAERRTTQPVARFFPPSAELIRFHSKPTLVFLSSEVESVTPPNVANGLLQWHVDVNFMGLAGSSGVLPHHYTELMLQRLKLKDRSLVDFLDLFNHRTISLFYQASIKYRFPIMYERNKRLTAPGGEKDSGTRGLLSLIGLGTSKLTSRLYTSDESLLFYAGLFTSKVRTSSGLKQIIRQHFKISVEIDEFVGQWRTLIDDVRTRLGRNSRVGMSVMLGRQGWFSQGKFRVILGPLSRTQQMAFAPGAVALKAVNEIVRLYVGFEHEYEIVMRIKRADIPTKVALSGRSPPVIGWNTWMSTSGRTAAQADETVDIPVSAGVHH